MLWIYSVKSWQQIEVILVISTQNQIRKVLLLPEFCRRLHLLVYGLGSKQVSQVKTSLFVADCCFPSFSFHCLNKKTFGWLKQLKKGYTGQPERCASQKGLISLLCFITSLAVYKLISFATQKYKTRCAHIGGERDRRLLLVTHCD